MNIRDFIVSLREGRYTSVGSYPKCWITRDNATLCYDCCRDNIMLIGRAMRDGHDKQWEVVSCDANWEDPLLFCDHCSKRIESAYAEDAAAE